MKEGKRSRVQIVPLTPARAQRVVQNIHRHHGPVPGGYAMWALGAVVDGRLCGAAIMGRPTNRNSDDGQTAEVLRIATDGTPNTSSALLGACRRVAVAAGYSKVITYTLQSESGASLRGAGWNRDKDGIKSWWNHDCPSARRDGRTVTPRAHYDEGKVRWSVQIRPPLVVDLSPSDPPKATTTSPQASLFGGMS